MRPLTDYEVKPEAQAVLQDPALVEAALKEGKELYEIMGFDKEVILDFYEIACRLSEERKYEDSLAAFAFLTNVAPRIPAFWAGRAYVCELMQDYPGAQHCYQIAVLNDPEHIDYYFSAIQCSLDRKEYDDASKYAEAAAAASETMQDPDLAKELKAHADALLRDIQILASGGIL